MEQIQRIICGNVNCYLISNGNYAILVDTGREKHRQKVLDACRPYQVRLLVLTHGHMDHAQNAAFLSRELNCPVAMHRADLDLLKDNMSQALSANTILGRIVLSASVNGTDLIVGDALMNMVYPTVSMLYHDRGTMLESARKIEAFGGRNIHFGHGKSVKNRKWAS